MVKSWLPILFQVNVNQEFPYYRGNPSKQQGLTTPFSFHDWLTELNEHTWVSQTQEGVTYLNMK
jgi:hypothetical protein